MDLDTMEYGIWDGINELARWKKLFVEAAMMGYLAGK
jgi:hypothetical protein